MQRSHVTNKRFFSEPRVDRSQSVLEYLTVRKSVTTDKRQNVCVSECYRSDFGLLYEETLPAVAT